MINIPFSLQYSVLDTAHCTLYTSHCTLHTEACNSVTVPDKSCQASFVYPHPPPTTAQDYLRYVEGKFVFSSPMRGSDHTTLMAVLFLFT